MPKNLNIELFRFDANSDYLSYYTKHKLQFKSDDTVLDLLRVLGEKEELFFESDCNVKINGLYLNSCVLVSDVVRKLGGDLIIEPVSIYEAKKDFIVDKSEFLNKLDILDNYLTTQQREQAINNYELHYYASNTLNIKKDYIGDHVLFAAYDLIKSNSNFKDEVLEIIAHKENGIWYHTSLKNRIFNYSFEDEKKIDELLRMVGSITLKKLQEQSVDVNEVKQKFSNFNIATYDGLYGDSLENIVTLSGANYLDITSKNDDLGFESLQINDDFSLQLAGNVLLEAKDNGADFMLVSSNEYLNIFDKQQKKIEKLVGREINLPIVSQEQFAKLMQGQEDNTINEHKIKISFL
jgi:heterodisulfide reductase subunit B